MNELSDLRRALAAAVDQRPRATGWEPELCYGRHRGPSIAASRPAAVLILLCPADSGWWIPLILRPHEMPFHGGQIALPGGGCQCGESVTDCAVREAEEELGISAGDLTVLGALSPVYIFSSNFLAHPVVAGVRRTPEFHPCSREVARVLRVNTQQLRRPPEPQPLLARKHAFEFAAPSIPLGDVAVWGATSVILGQFAQVLPAS